jgi:ESF2/ABP1 family protein
MVADRGGGFCSREQSRPITRAIPQALKNFHLQPGRTICSNFTIGLGMSSMEECKAPEENSLNDDSQPSLKRRRLGSNSMESHESELSDHDSEESLEFEFDSDEESHPPQPKSSKKRTVANVLSRDKLEESRAAIDKTGVIYLSRIPPRMSPTKIRQLLSAFKSPVLRIFLSPESTAVYTRRVKSGGSKKRQFTEGWVEFEDKKVAKKAAELLNAQQIGGKKGSFWYDDIWNIKYLPKFKWHHLTEPIGTPQSPVFGALLIT